MFWNATGSEHKFKWIKRIWNKVHEYFQKYVYFSEYFKFNISKEKYDLLWLSGLFIMWMCR